MNSGDHKDANSNNISGRVNWYSKLENVSTQDPNDFLTILNTDTDEKRITNYNDAFLMLDHLISSLEMKKGHGQQAVLAKKFRRAVKEKSELSSPPEQEKQLRLMEEIIRFMHKVDKPEHQINAIDGSNTRRLLDISEITSQSDWEKINSGPSALESTRGNWYVKLKLNENKSPLDKPHADDDKFFRDLTYDIETNIMAHGLQRLRNNKKVAEGKRRINEDYDNALAMLHNLCAEQSNDTSLRLFRDAITEQAYKIPTREKPFLTENIIRFMHKVEYPNDPINDALEGSNTRRGFAGSAQISKFQWGKFIGGLGMFLFGAALVALSSLMLAASCGATAPLEGLLTGIGFSSVAASSMSSTLAFATATGATNVSAFITAVPMGLGSLLMYYGGRKVVRSVRDKFSSDAPGQIIRREGQALFKPPASADDQKRREEGKRKLPY